MSIYKRVEEHRWFLLGLAILTWVVAINHFPSGHIILGGDVLQPINLDEKFNFLYHEWFGRSSIFYGFFYLLDILGVTSTAQLSVYLAIFLFGAYFSFISFCRLIFPHTVKWASVGLSLFYATNVYTLYIFTSTWGFTGYQILYVFIPILTGLYMKVLETSKSSFVFLFLLVMAVTSTSFGNPAFALSLGVYFFLLTLILFGFRFASFDRDAVKRIVLLAIGALLLNAYWILPLAPQVRGGVEEVNASSDIVLSEALAKTSNAIFDTIRLLPTHEQKIYYPYNFPYPSISWAKYGIALLVFIPFFIVLAGLFFRKSREQKILYFTFFALFVVFIALVARVRFPFDSFNSVLFQLPGFNVLRGWDKLAIYTPFLLSVLLLGFFSAQQGKKYFRIGFVGFAVVGLLLALPFYAGGIQTELSYILSGNKKKDFTTASYSALVKIPDSYYAVADIFKQDESESKISMLPFSPGSSVGRVNLPNWKVNGPHPAHALYAKKYVELNDYYLGKWMFAKEFDKSEYDPQWITDLYGLIGIEYVFYHHDAKPKATEKFEPARQYLEEKGILQQITENEWFTLYRLDKQYLFPYVYANSDIMTIESRVGGISEKIRDFRSYMTPLSYERKNPKEIIVSVDAVVSDSFVFLNEEYDPLWRAEYISPDGKRVSLVRNDDVKYANAWRVAEFDSQGTINIYYMPIRLFYIGEWISGLTLLVVIFGAVTVLRKKE